MGDQGFCLHFFFGANEMGGAKGGRKKEIVTRGQFGERCVALIRQKI